MILTMSEQSFIRHPLDSIEETLFSIFYSNYEAKAITGLVEILDEMFPQYYLHSDDFNQPHDTVIS